MKCPAGRRRNTERRKERGRFLKRKPGRGQKKKKKEEYKERKGKGGRKKRKEKYKENKTGLIYILKV